MACEYKRSLLQGSDESYQRYEMMSESDNKRMSGIFLCEMHEDHCPAQPHSHIYQPSIEGSMAEPNHASCTTILIVVTIMAMLLTGWVVRVRPV